MRGWILIVSLLALLGFALRQRLARGATFATSSTSDAPAASRSVAASPALTPSIALADRPAAAPRDGEHDELRALALGSEKFARLPGADQTWVLALARARVADVEDERLPQLIDELSEIRLFAVSEREDPLPMPLPDPSVATAPPALAPSR